MFSPGPQRRYLWKSHDAEPVGPDQRFEDGPSDLTSESAPRSWWRPGMTGYDRWSMNRIDNRIPLFDSINRLTSVEQIRQQNQLWSTHQDESLSSLFRVRVWKNSEVTVEASDGLENPSKTGLTPGLSGYERDMWDLSSFQWPERLVGHGKVQRFRPFKRHNSW